MADYTLLYGSFVIRYPDLPRQGPEPDGDTTKFAPANQELLKTIPRISGRPPKLSRRGISVHLEAIDALETHFQGTHQELAGGKEARDVLLANLGFTNIEYWEDLPNKVKSADQDSLPGFVLSNGIDANGRLIGFAYTGSEGPGEDGAIVTVDDTLIDKSVNTKLVSDGLVFPAFYGTLSTILREHLSTKFAAARTGEKGIWRRATGLPRRSADIYDLGSLTISVIWPKLFRRLAVFINETGPGLDGFEEWLREDGMDRDDMVFRLDTVERVRFHDVLEIVGNTIALKIQPELILIEPDPNDGDRPLSASHEVISVQRTVSSREGKRAIDSAILAPKDSGNLSQTIDEQRAIESAILAPKDSGNLSQTIDEHDTNAQSEVDDGTTGLSVDGGYAKFKLTPGEEVPRPGFIDEMKALIEKSVGRPIIWWPLRPTRYRCPADMTRMSWCCDCGVDLHLDVPKDVAQEYVRNRASSGSPSNRGGHILPMYNLKPSSSTQASNSRSQKPIEPKSHTHTQGGDISIENAHQTPTPDLTTKMLFILWCIGAGARSIQELFHITVRSLSDTEVIPQLKSTYQDYVPRQGFMRSCSWIKRIQKQLSLHQVQAIKFVQFHVLEDKDFVTCASITSNVDMMPSATNKDYTYKCPADLIEKEFLEVSIMHRFHDSSRCTPSALPFILDGIPKKNESKLSMVCGIQGYGMRPVLGWAVWKIVVALVITLLGPMIFAIVWLCLYPGAMSDAFTPALWAASIFATVIVFLNWNMME